MDHYLHVGYLDCYIGSLLSVILFYPLLLPKNIILATFVSALNSFFLIPLVPIMLELGCELVFPVGEGSAVGMLFAVGNLGGFILGAILTLYVKGENGKETFNGLMFCAVIFVLGLVLVFFMKEEKNREKAEEEQSEARKSLIGSTIENEKIVS
jgi:FLVCR family feline leukemia virus subgroup C receptor-related protein